MIENMRKYTGLMVVVLILLAAGLVLTMGDFRANTGSRIKVTEVYGKAIDKIEFKKLGRNSITTIQQLNNPKLSNYAIDLMHNQNLGPYAAYGFSRTGYSVENETNFVNRRIVVAKTAADYGIYPSAELAKNYITEELFLKDKQFDRAKYDDFIKNLGSAGMQEEDFVNLIAESLVYEKLKSLISSDLESPNTLTSRAIKFNQQTLDLTEINIDIAPYKAKITPTEEEISTYWKENDFNYLTDRKIRISYIAEMPVYDSPKPKAPKRKPETTEEEFKKLDDAYKANIAAWEINEEKPANNKLAGIIDEVSALIDESEGERFSEEIASAGLKMVSTELFSNKEVSQEIKKLKTADGQSIANILFQTKISDSLQYRIPAPIRLEGNGWFYVRYDEEAKPEKMTYELAKELAKTDLIQKLAHSAMLEEVAEIKEKLTKNISGGSTAVEAAQINNLVGINKADLTYDKLPKDQRGQALKPDGEIFENGSITSIGSFSENNVVSDSKVTLIYLNNRHVVNSSDIVDNRLRIQESYSQRLQDFVFRTWLDDATAKANIPPVSFKSK